MVIGKWTILKRQWTWTRVVEYPKSCACKETSIFCILIRRRISIHCIKGTELGSQKYYMDDP